MKTSKCIHSNIYLQEQDMGEHFPLLAYINKYMLNLTNSEERIRFKWSVIDMICVMTVPSNMYSWLNVASILGISVKHNEYKKV